jgi:hypothetical protein
MQDTFTTGHAVTILRNTLRRLEQSGAFDQDDPAFIHLKRRMILAIAELEMSKNLKSSVSFEEPIVVLCVRGFHQPKRSSQPEVVSQEN